VTVVGYSFNTFDRAAAVSFEVQRGKWGWSAAAVQVAAAPVQGYVPLQQPFTVSAAGCSLPCFDGGLPLSCCSSVLGLPDAAHNTAGEQHCRRPAHARRKARWQQVNMAEFGSNVASM
jgi:hypothetical protein